MQPERFIFCGGLAPSGPLPEGATTIGLDLWGLKTAKNVFLHIDDIHSPLWRNIAPEFEDLVEIATYVYCADQMSNRVSEDVELMGSYWRRSFNFTIPVRRPEIWNDPVVKRTLTDALTFQSDDSYAFNFIKADSFPGIQLYLKGTEAPLSTKPLKEVLMFSGGLDSLSGAIQETVVAKKNVLLLTHKSTPKRNSIVSNLARLLAEKAAPYKPVHMHVEVNKKSEFTKDTTQRARSFLYVAIGSTVAHMLGMTELKFYENGVVTFNLPISAQVIGSKSTRSTHPKVLAGYEALVSLLAGHSFKIRNPFVFKTRTEVIQEIISAGCADLIAPSISCARTRPTTGDHPQCGRCSQCLDRRISIAALDRDDLDPIERYEIDVFKETPGKDVDKMMLSYFLSRAQHIRMLRNTTAFIAEYPDVLKAVRHLESSVTSAADRIFSLYQRHAEDVAKATKRILICHADNLIARDHEEGSFVRTVVDPHAATVLPAPVVAAPTVAPAIQGESDGHWYFGSEGATYRIRLPEGEFTLPKRAGEDYLSWFVRHAREEINVLDLVQSVRGTPPTIVTVPTDETDDAPAESDGIIADAVVDEKTLSKVRDRLKQIQQDRRKAEDAGNQNEIDKLNEEVEQLTTYLASTTNNKGLSRVIPTDAKKAETSIRRELNRCYERALTPSDGQTTARKSFVQHFKESITVGFTCCYKPADTVSWRFPTK